MTVPGAACVIEMHREIDRMVYALYGLSEWWGLGVIHLLRKGSDRRGIDPF